jgi:RNase P subunit RPR2
VRADEQEEKKAVICARCKVPLAPGKVNIKYLGSTFPAELLRCPSCGLVYVSEELATGKMTEVEKSLEDK